MKQSIQKANARSLFSRCAKKVTACVLSTVLLLTCFPLALAAEPDTDPLTAQELTQMTDEQIAALSQEQSDATLNKMAQLWLDGETDILCQYFSALGFATTYSEYQKQLGEAPASGGTIQPLWSSDYDKNGNGKPEEQCHEMITASGFLVYLAARNIAFNGGSIGYTLSELSSLAVASEEPDKTDPGFLFDSHFYNPDTGTNWRGDASPTARTKAEGYYDVAVKNYAANNRALAIQSLGHCLHFVQDAGEPHHAANEVALLSNHSSFEKETAQWLYSGEFEYDLEETFEYDIIFYNGFVSRSVGETVHAVAVDAKSMIDAAESSTAGIRKLAAYFSIGNSMQYSAGIMYKFAKEVGMI